MQGYQEIFNAANRFNLYGLKPDGRSFVRVFVPSSH
jgi:hypothetical protein